MINSYMTELYIMLDNAIRSLVTWYHLIIHCNSILISQRKLRLRKNR